MKSLAADDGPGTHQHRRRGMTIRRLIQVLFATLTALALLAAVSISLAAARRRGLVDLQQRHFDAYKLAIALRQSSDDLTRLARTYVATGDAKYERFYHQLVGIRAGTLPRPVDYGPGFWDRMIVGDTAVRTGPPVPMQELMRQTGFTDAELAQLRTAQARSDSLVLREEEAFHALKGQFADATGAYRLRGPPDSALARRLLFGEEYHRQKARIMAPIDSVLLATSSRTRSELDAFTAQTRRAFILIEALFVVFLVAVAASYPLLRARVLTPVSSLQEQTRSLARDIEQLATVSTSIAHGKLDQAFAARTPRIGSERGDEIGELSRLHDSMVEQLDGTGAAIASMTGDLRKANDYLRTILETSPIAVAVTVNGITRFANPRCQELLGSVVGAKATSVWAEREDRDEMLAKLEQDGLVRDVMTRFQSRSRTIDVMCTFYKIEYEGEPAILGWIVDVTQLKDIEKALQESTRRAEAAAGAKSRFLASMSHEIRTPMNAILGYSQLLQGESLPEGQRRKVDAIAASGDHLLSLINDVLEMSRIEAGRTTLSVQAFDLHNLVDTVQSMFREQLTARGIMLDVQMDASVVRGIRSDPGKVRQVLINLVGNALKFTDRGGVTIRVTSAHQGSTGSLITIDVEDTGPGISAEEQVKLFSAFEQTSTGMKHGGTGLGLAISRSFARLLGGDLTLRSTVGKGSIFTFTFLGELAAEEEVSAVRSRSRPTRLDPSAGRVVALVVDDVASNREVLAEGLTRAGFEVHTASTGEEALDVDARVTPNIILMDLHMPGMGGFAAIRELRARRSSAAIIVTTASTDPAAERTSEIGAQGLVRKPYREADLLAMISRVLNVKMIEVRSPDSGPARQAISLASELRQLPTTLTNELRAACLQARSGTVIALADRVEPHSPEAAQMIRDIAGNFRYQQLLDALDEATHAVH
jgi:two-component system, sensor histidine kinase and response regulator